MQAVLYDHFGGPEVLELRELPAPKPSADEVLIENHYTSVNPIDWKLREGIYASLLKFEFPVIPGWDVAGVVTEAGSEVAKFSPGDRVFGMAVSDPIGIGSYAEQTLGREAVLAAVPDRLSLRDAAAIPLVATAAHDALFRLGQIEAGQRVLIHQGAGGVGCIAIQLAKAAGAFVYTTCSTGNVEYVSRFGADHVIDYTREDFASVIMSAEADGLDYVLDGVGGETFTKSHGLVKQNGVLITMGDFPDAELAASHGIRTAFLDSTASGNLLAEIAMEIDQSRMALPDIIELPLAEAAEAQRRSQTGHVRGKIVLKCGAA
ncbi:MAG: NADP-dependent oxidoreductase [Gammaproteobacteria bacterium]